MITFIYYLSNSSHEIDPILQPLPFKHFSTSIKSTYALRDCLDLFKDGCTYCFNREIDLTMIRYQIAKKYLNIDNLRFFWEENNQLYEFKISKYGSLIDSTLPDYSSRMLRDLICAQRDFRNEKENS